MKNQFMRNLAAILLTLGIVSISQGEIIVVEKSKLPMNCVSIGIFEGSAGYGKSIDGIRIALYRALDKATNAGACHAVVKILNRGLSSQDGYALVEGFSCSDDEVE